MTSSRFKAKTNPCFLKNRIRRLFTRTLVILLGLLGLPISVCSAFELMPLWQNQESEFRTLTFKTDLGVLGTHQNGDEAGNWTSVPGLNSVSHLNTQALVAWRGQSPWTLYGRLTVVNATIETQSGDAPPTRASRLGLGDQMIGFNLRLNNQRDPETAPSAWRFNLQSELKIPFYSVDTAAPVLGNGSADWTLSLFATHPLALLGAHRLDLELSTGVDLRSSGYSADLPLSVQFLATPLGSSGWKLSAGLAGFLSLHTDSRFNASPQGSGGSALIGSVNPTHFLLHTQLGYDFLSGSSLSAWGTRTLIAENAPIVTAIGLAYAVPLTTTRVELTHRASSVQAAISPTVASSPGRPVDAEFRATVTSVHERLHLVKIDRGQKSNLQKGQTLYLFENEQKTQATAKSEIEDLRSGEAVLRIVEYFDDTPLHPGLVARDRNESLIR